jgi:hypothetical protein
MAKAISERLVIDASVARSSGRAGAAHCRATACRDFLLAVLEICHRLVMTPAIRDEWRKHASSFARTWRVSMEARKKVVRPDVPESEALGIKASSLFQGADRAAVLKDLHLLEAAIATDHIVVSCDDEAKRLFACAAGTVRELADVAWVNPGTTPDMRPWLENGAERKAAMTLGGFKP